MKIKEHNATTNEIIERNMTAAELAQYEIDEAARAEQITQIESKATAKAALLERLGITSDEAALLLG